MMKLFWHRLSSWWFATMVPAYGPVTTIAARETLRKRRLFSSILLIGFTAGVFLTLQCLLSNALLSQKAMIMIATCIPPCALWINQRGYLKCASVVYFLLSLLIVFIGISSLSPENPLALYTWPTLLLLPVISALFLPAWGPLLLTFLEIAFMSWFIHYGGQSQIALYLPDPQSQMQLLFLNCTLIFLAGVFSAVSAITTEKAVTQADRTVELEHAYTLLETAHTAIQEQAVTDGLTGLPNHRAIVERIEVELQQCQSSQRNGAILFVDIDHFKQINDTWGHAAGDAVLSEVGRRLRQGIRKSDSIGRYGGEEFAILLPDTEQMEAYALAERLRCSLASAPYLWQQKEMPSIPIELTGSFGLAIYPLDGLSARELLETADAAMYRAKHTGRNRVCLSDEDELKGDILPQYSEQNVLKAISTMTAFHDQGTQAHANRMIHLAEATMRMLRRSEDEIVLLRLAAQLHDIGKIGIPEGIVQKPGPLTPDEWEIMRRHPQIGQQILVQAKGQIGLVSHIVVAHHERWDGQGYPYGLAEQEIPLGARILSVVDAYDAMTSSRPYREALPGTVAQEELQRCAGTQFDPQVVAAFLQVLQAQEPLCTQDRDPQILGYR